MTQKFALIGHPVGHSLSPTIHGRAYELLGREAHYELIDAVDEAAVRAALERVRSGELTGVNVTVPWKLLALEACDRVDDSAARVGAANVIARASDGALVAYNTDALALADELAEARAELGVVAQGALVLGSGGAALAAVVSAELAGFSPIWVSARRFHEDRAEDSWPGSAEWKRLGARMLAWPPTVPAGTAAIIQASSAGMKGSEGGAELSQLVPWDRLPRLLAYDLVYNPARTPFLEAALESGHLARGGLGMLVGQAARAIEIWWGVRPDAEPLLEAAARALGLD